MFKKIIYDLKIVFSDIKKFENTKTLHRDKRENLNKTNKDLLIFMLHKY